MQPLETFRIFSFLLMCILISLVAQSFGLFIGAIMDTKVSCMFYSKLSLFSRLFSERGDFWTILPPTLHYLLRVFCSAKRFAPLYAVVVPHIIFKTRP